MSWFRSSVSVSLIFLLGLVGWKQICGFTVGSSLHRPGFSSLLELKAHNSKKSESRSRGHNPNIAKWQRFGGSSKMLGAFPEQLLAQLSEHDRRRLMLQDSPAIDIKLEHGSILNGKQPSSLGRKRGSALPPVRSPIDELLISRPSPAVQFWSKRDTKEKVIPHNVLAGVDPAKTQRSNKYKMLDNALEQLVPDSRCKKRINLCAKMPVRNLDCILHCHLSNHVLGTSPTKFLFRLWKVYATYPKMLCPTFGRIYDEIPSILRKKQRLNSVKRFLEGVGIVESAPVNIDFIKISPSSLFNNMVKFGLGDDLELVRSIIGTAETASRIQLSEKNMFPADYGNPLCKLMPKEGWFVSLIDSMTKHPTLTDIFLRGYWILTRALSMEMPYPIDGMFVSIVFSIKLLTGVDCSIIAYAEHGKPFKCRRPIPIDDVLDSYVETDESEDSKYSWLVCGAHQVEIPEWIQDKEGLNGRMDDTRESNSTNVDGEMDLGLDYEDLDKLSNPEELYPLT